MSTLVRVLFLLLRALEVEVSRPLARLLLLLLFLPHMKEIERTRQRLDGRRGWGGFWLRNAWRLGEYLPLMLQIGKRGDWRFIERVPIEGEHYLRDSLDRHKGVIMVSLHLGPWELLPQIFAARGYPVWLGLGHQRDPWLDRTLKAIRTNRGVKMAYRVSEMERPLNCGGVLGFVLDNTHKTRGIELPGFGFRVLRTPFVLARRHRVPILPVRLKRRGPGLVAQVGRPSSISELGAVLKGWVLDSPEDWVCLGKG